MPMFTPVDKSLFDHIKIDHTNWDGRCPLEDDFKKMNSPGMIDPDSDHMSWLLSQILDEVWLAGTREVVSNRRKVILMKEYAYDTVRRLERITGGSVGEGMIMQGGDLDIMEIDTETKVIYPDEYDNLPEDCRQKTVLFMREADCQPGYVALELGNLGQRCLPQLRSAVVPVGDSEYISSDIYRQERIEEFKRHGLVAESNGPCGTMTDGNARFDNAFSFHCSCWPNEAKEWVYRSRQNGWPSQDLRDKIVQSGCHLVPVGDKCSSDTFLQWRISFLTAERRLIHSLSHQQFRIYGLLKYFLKQITEILESIIGDSDILCSYFIKTLMFHAVENSPATLWQEKHTLFCFRFCLRILIEWIKDGNCPNYFIKNNNMFKRKVHGENQQKLLHILTDMYQIRWMSLAVGTFFLPSIGENLHQAIYGQLSEVLTAREERECHRDMDISIHLSEPADPDNMSNTALMRLLRLLSESQSDTDEFIAYYLFVGTLCDTAKSTCTTHRTPGGNKQKYREIKKCKRSLTPLAAMCPSPGLLYLATFHYHTGNYRKSLEMCGEVTSYRRCCDGPEFGDYERYQRLYCERGYSLYHKFKEGFAFRVVFYKESASFCIPHFHLELTRQPRDLVIPPLPYAVFLSFLCYHDLGDTRKRDTALLHLRAVNYDPKQGGHKHWIVHTLLGICFETVGDNRRAIRSYTDSAHVEPEWNPAMERIEALRCPK